VFMAMAMRLFLMLFSWFGGHAVDVCGLFVAPLGERRWWFLLPVAWRAIVSSSTSPSLTPLLI